MASRMALNKAKPLKWGCVYQLVSGKFGFLSALSHSHSRVIGLHSRLLPPASSNQSCRRHYYLPPPPPSLKMAADSNYHQFGIASIANDDKGALSSAEFAVMVSSKLERRKIRFERLVRASAIRFADSIYYLTLEGTDEEKGDLNIYYAVVVDFLSIKTKKVIRWQLVDESFSYPFQETRFSELHKKEQQQDSEVSDSLTRAWLMGMALQSKDDRTYATYFDFGENSPGIINFCPPWAQKKNMDPLSTVASDTMVPVDVKNNKKICKYALSAVKIYKKKDDCVELDLKEVWGASKSVVDSGVFYLLLFNAVYDELNNYCAIIKVLGSKVELMMLHNVESYVNPP